MIWKPSAQERKTIREYAAKAAEIKPAQTELRVLRRAIIEDPSNPFSRALYDQQVGVTNVLIVGGFYGTHFAGWERWSEWKSCEMVGGCAALDLAVYQKGGEQLTLITQVQAVAGTMRKGTKARLAWIEENGERLFTGRPAGGWNSKPDAQMIWGPYALRKKK